MKIKLVIFTIGLAALMTTLASANTLTYVIYTNAVEFAEAVGNFSEYDFESIPTGTDCKNYDFGDFAIDGAALYAVTIVDDHTHEINLSTSSSSQDMSVSFHTPIIAFGCDWRNTDGNGDILRVDFDGTRYVLGTSGDFGFWGVVATEGLITSDIPFLFGDTPGGGWLGSRLDNFRYAETVTVDMAQAAFVTIGDAGNAADSTGYGAVSYEYSISVHEVTIAEMVASGAGDGDENYWNDGSRTVGTNAPATYITLYEAMKYCNYLTSGNVTNGYYSSSDGGVTYQASALAHDAYAAANGITYFVPTDDEWYKAAYWTGSGYSLYADGTGTAPTDVATADQTGWNYEGANTGNIGAWVTGGSALEQNDTYDMMGNVWEWMEDDAGVIRGGSYTDSEDYLRSSYRGNYNPPNEHTSVGFRPVKVVPELAASTDDYFETVVSNAPVAYWRFSETSGTNAFNSGSLGAAANGIYGSNVELGRAGLPGFSADPALGLQAKDIQSRMLLTSFPMPQAAVSITFLVNGQDNGLSHFMGYGVAGSYNEFLLGSSAGLFRYAIQGSIYDFQGVDVLDGVTHHVGITWEAATGAMVLYVDGYQVGSRTVATGNLLSSGGVLAVAQDLDSMTPPNYGMDSSQAFVGTLDELAVFETVLTPQEILNQAAAAIQWEDSKSLQFDGVNDYVTFGAATAELGASNFTVEVWFKRTGAGTTADTGIGGIDAVPLVSKGRGELETAGLNCNYFLGINGNVLAADFEELSGPNHPVSGSSTIAYDEWNHAAATYDGSALKIYLNGQLEGATLVSATPDYTSTQHAALGSALNSSGATEGFFSGLLDEARIWNYARSQVEIQTEMYNELPAAPGLLGRWGMEEDVGLVASNSISGSVDGTLKNGTGRSVDHPVEGNPTPVVAITNLVAAQVPGTKTVEITYDVSSTETNAVTVSLVISNGTSVVDCPSVTGDVGAGVALGTGKSMVWDVGADANGLFSSTISYALTAVEEGSGSTTPGGMALIPSGSVLRDSDSGGGTLSNSTAFYMDVTEVTKAQWDTVYNWAVANEYGFSNAGLGKGTDHPVHTVNWYDCVKWCNARSEKEGKTPCYTVSSNTYKMGESTPDCNLEANGYRLPTSEEWEYAARGGLSGNRFPWGDTINHDNANYVANGSAHSYDTSPYTSYTFHPDYDDGGEPYTSPAGEFSPNAYGLYDMAGNVWEWSNTSFVSGRRMQGGAWAGGADGASFGFPGWNSLNVESNGIGFRAICR